MAHDMGMFQVFHAHPASPVFLKEVEAVDTWCRQLDIVRIVYDTAVLHSKFEQSIDSDVSTKPTTRDIGTLKLLNHI